MPTEYQVNPSAFGQPCIGVNCAPAGSAYSLWEGPSGISSVPLPASAVAQCADGYVWMDGECVPLPTPLQQEKIVENLGIVIIGVGIIAGFLAFQVLGNK